MGKRQPVHHVLDVYGAHLWLATGPKQLRRLSDKFEDDGLGGGLGTTSLILDQQRHTPHVVIWIDVEAHAADALALVQTCAHEAAHVATMLLRHIGHTIRSEDEPHAYLVGWVTAWILEQIDWTPS